MKRRNFLKGTGSLLGAAALPWRGAAPAADLGSIGFKTITPWGSGVPGMQPVVWLTREELAELYPSKTIHD